MKTAKHTAAPWAFKMSFGCWHVYQNPENWDGRGYQGICTIPAERKGTQAGEMFAANASLITASPTMYSFIQKCADAGDEEALQILESIIGCQCPSCQIVKHDSDCAVHNMPAHKNRPCNCSASAATAIAGEAT